MFSSFVRQQDLRPRQVIEYYFVVRTLTITNQYTQIDRVRPKITYFKDILGCAFYWLLLKYN